MAEIRLEHVHKVYPNGLHAVKDVCLDIAHGEFLIMVGPSGCAKSTILRTIAGLETPTAGTVNIGGKVVNDIPPQQRDIAMVFQSYALYPHMTVAENMAFGLRLRRMPDDEIQRRIADAARILGLEDLLSRRPKEMSGGQRQRVAMGRAIVREPQAFLMDEPLSNLDAKLRVQMRTEIARLHQRLGTTTVYVTHDQVEAMTLGQRICVLRRGIVQQVDTPAMVYTNPFNMFVAGFIGSPGMNFWTGRIEASGGRITVRTGDTVLQLPQSVADRFTFAERQHGRQVHVGIRPEHLRPVGTVAANQVNVIRANVELVEVMGSEAYAYFSSALPTVASRFDESAAQDANSAPSIARVDAAAAPHAGSMVNLAVDIEEIQLFEADTELSLLAPRPVRNPAAVEAPNDASIPLAAPVAAHARVDLGTGSTLTPGTSIRPEFAG